MNIFYVFFNYRQIHLFWQEMKIRILIKCLIFLYSFEDLLPSVKVVFCLQYDQVYYRLYSRFCMSINNIKAKTISTYICPTTILAVCIIS